MDGSGAQFVKALCGLSFLSATAPALAALTQPRAYSADDQRCMAGSGGVTVAMRDCSATEHDRLDAELNRRYRGLMSSLPPSKAVTLRNAQRRWLADRRRVCDAAVRKEGAGTLALVVGDGCYLDRLYDRVAELQAMKR